MSVDQERRAVQVVSQTVAAEVLGFKSAGSLRAMRGAPRNKDRAATYSLMELVPWYVAHERAGGVDPDAAAMTGDCPHAIRWRKERADQMEIKSANMRKELIHVSVVNPTLQKAAAILRGGIEQLERDFGAEAASVMRDAVSDALAAADTLVPGGSEADVPMTDRAMTPDSPVGDYYHVGKQGL
jgi:hypothetical protein